VQLITYIHSLCLHKSNQIASWQIIFNVQKKNVQNALRKQNNQSPSRFTADRMASFEKLTYARDELRQMEYLYAIGTVR